MDMSVYLLPTSSMDLRHPLIQAFVARHVDEDMDDLQKAVALYHTVRDDIRYDPYRIELTVEGMRASTTLNKRYGWCVSKAVLLTACYRACGIPARLGFGDVKNHMSTERLRKRMETDVFYWHGYTETFLNGRWVKCTPAFNRSLCEKLGLQPLDFDGIHDSIFHPFDQAGNRFMEYLNERGSYDDLPLHEILATFKCHYKGMLEAVNGNFEIEAANEAQVTSGVYTSTGR